jgi:hypothetical protein
MPVDQDDEEANNRLNSIVDSVLQNNEEREKIHNQLYEEKLKDVLKNSVKLNEKEVTHEKFIEIVQEQNKNDK